MAVRPTPEPLTETAPALGALRAALTPLADQLHGVAVDMGHTNPGLHPIDFGTKQRWSQEIESIEQRLRNALRELPE